MIELITGAPPKRSLEKRGGGCRFDCTESVTEDKEAGTVIAVRKCEPTPECTSTITIPAPVVVPAGSTKRSLEKRGGGCRFDCTESVTEDKEAGTVIAVRKCEPTPECT